MISKARWDSSGTCSVSLGPILVENYSWGSVGPKLRSFPGTLLAFVIMNMTTNIDLN